MEKADGQGNAEFKTLVQDWKYDVPITRLDSQYDVQSIDQRDNLASSHLPTNVLAHLETEPLC